MWPIKKGTPDYQQPNTPSCFKILALPEHFSPQQLQDIVDGKLKEGQKILLECEDVGDCKEYDTDNNYCTCKDGCKDLQIKLNPHITIYPPVEEKMYTREEVKNIALKAYERGFIRPIYEKHFDIWFEQNVK